jgi:cell filamentation protein
MYDAVSDSYCYPGTTVLKNRAGSLTQADLDFFEEEAGSCAHAASGYSASTT